MRFTLLLALSAPLLALTSPAPMRQAGSVAQQLAFDGQSAAERVQAFLTDNDDDKCPDLVVRCVKDGDVTKVIGDVSFFALSEWEGGGGGRRAAKAMADGGFTHRSASRASARKASNACSATVRRTRASLLLSSTSSLSSPSPNSSLTLSPTVLSDETASSATPSTSRSALASARDGVALFERGDAENRRS